jgi:hypothetical protein
MGPPLRFVGREQCRRWRRPAPPRASRRDCTASCTLVLRALPSGWSADERAPASPARNTRPTLKAIGRAHVHDIGRRPQDLVHDVVAAAGAFGDQAIDARHPTDRARPGQHDPRLRAETASGTAQRTDRDIARPPAAFPAIAEAVAWTGLPKTMLRDQARGLGGSGSRRGKSMSNVCRTTAAARRRRLPDNGDPQAFSSPASDLSRAVSHFLHPARSPKASH